MDNLRGNLSGYGSPADDGPDYDRGEDESPRELPPAAIGQDERRMQVRAYNFWASLLTDRNLPSIEDLDPQDLPDFGPNSVLLDFSMGIEDPAIVFLGSKLATECGSTGPISKLSDVPSRSLLSRITDHHLQIIANQAPIGFEAEFVNQRGMPIMYRGILLPFSSDDDTIDFIFGVINWKELADQQTTDELLLEIDQALEAGPEPARADSPLTEWADGPISAAQALNEDEEDEEDGYEASGMASLTVPEPAATLNAAMPAPNFGRRRRGLVSEDDWDDIPATDADSDDASDALDEIGAEEADAADDIYEMTQEYAEAEELDDALDLSVYAELDDELTLAAPEAEFFAPQAQPEGEMELADWLAAARELAHAAQSSEDRSRQSLYAAIGRAYDFSLAAAADPEGFAELVADAGLTVQDRAPMTPLVKLVFGATYDKTRLTEYAAALSHAHRLELGRGGLEVLIASAPGGLKGIVQAERNLRREAEGGAPVKARSPRERLAGKLRKIEHKPLSEVDTQGSEFTLLVARRLASGEVVLLGEVADDTLLLERAARRLIA